MFKWLTCFFIVLMSLGLSCSIIKRTSDIKIINARCEYLQNPLGIGETLPRLSWVLESPKRGQKQIAYRILVASSEKNIDNNTGDLWDTGKVESDQSNQIVYGGEVLESRMSCWWKVCVWDEDNRQSHFSDKAYWTMGLLSDTDWTAKWIAHNKPVSQKPESPPVPFFRKTFTLDQPVNRALVYVTARGLYELSINGKRVGEDLLSEWTDYNKRIQYRTYDVTSLIKSGNNVIGAIVGEGWYSGYIGWWRHKGFYGNQNSLIVQMEIERADGAKETIVSDETWLSSEGPILTSDLLQGETYDANKELTGWNIPDYDDSRWSPVITVEKPAVKLVPQLSQPIQITNTLIPVSVNEPKKGIYVFDLGQNMVGWVRLKVSGEKGTKVVMRFGERLNPDGTVYTANLRYAKATDTYILKGMGGEVYEPRFTFHGFQYVEIINFPGKPGLDVIQGCVIHSATPPTGMFKCSNDMVNKLWSNITWGQRGNFVSVPTDCPQRDERLGWMGDAQIFIRTATWNEDVAAFFTKWMNDIVDAQLAEGPFASDQMGKDMFSDISPILKGEDGKYWGGSPAWTDAGVIVPWTIFKVYGDTRIIEKHWDALAKFMNAIHEVNPDLIRKNKVGNNYGDWLSINADTPKDLIATAYWAYDAKLMSEMAHAVGRVDEATKYQQLFENIRTSFQKEFVSPEGRVYPLNGSVKDTGVKAPGTAFVGGKGETQTSYLLALYMGLIPEELRTQAAEYLVDNIKSKDWHLSTGFIGVRHLNPVLTMMGYSDVAYRLLLQDTFPSWGYSIKQGATTIWERWDGWTAEKGFQDPGMNSFNHYSLGSVGEWMYNFAAGIGLDPEVNAYKKFIIHPYPDASMENVEASYNSINGLIKSGWTWKDNTFLLSVTIPVNTTATVFVPSDEGKDVTENGKPVQQSEGITFIESRNGCNVYEVVPGSYAFSSTLTKSKG